jgi:hypothetical protein
VAAVKLGEGKLAGVSIAHLTGTDTFKLDDASVADLKKFIEAGNTLIIDAAGGSSAFAQAAETLLASLVPDAKPARLVGRDRPADPAADLLQLVGVILPKLLDRNFGAADLGHRIGPEAAENVADAPDREADDQAAHDDGHDGLADPGRSGFVDTAKHARVFPGRW